MEKQNYTCQIEAPVSAKEAFDGINNVPGWWAQNFEGSSTALEDVFTVHFGETFGTFRITLMAAGSKIVWFCEDCYLDLLKDKKEWKGTSIVWEISTAGDGCNLKMTHVGLVPGIECYNDCEQGWNFFTKESLLKLLTQGKGEPAVGIRATVSNEDRIYRGVLYPRSGGVRNLPGNNIVIDVKANHVEHVTAAHSVYKLNDASFDPKELKGAYYMIVENKPLYADIEPLEDLMAIARTGN